MVNDTSVRADRLASLPTVDNILEWMGLQVQVFLTTCEPDDPEARREMVSRLEQSARLLYLELAEAGAMLDLLNNATEPMGWDHEGGEA